MTTKTPVELGPGDINPNTKRIISPKFGENPGVLMFYADWCGACKNAKPIFDSFSQKHPNITSGKFNCEKDARHKQIASALGIKYYPTFVVIKHAGQSMQIPNDLTISHFANHV